MSWAIASIPFWLLGMIFGASAVICAIDGIKGIDPARKSAGNFLTGMVCCGAFFYLAAKIAS